VIFPEPVIKATTDLAKSKSDVPLTDSDLALLDRSRDFMESGFCDNTVRRYMLINMEHD
jgi:hypothetical protein